MSMFPGGSLFSPSKPRAPVAPPPVPERADPGIAAAALKRSKKIKAARRGLSATILTGPQGAGDLGTSIATEASRSRLLG